jgi:hypothetical protein
MYLERIDADFPPTILNLDRYEFFDRPVISVGRHIRSDLRLDSPQLPCLVSRKHAEIVFFQNVHAITDKASLNGTYVNDELIIPLIPRYLRNGDVIGFGGPATVSRNNQLFHNLFRYRYTHDINIFSCVQFDETVIISCEKSPEEVENDKKKNVIDLTDDDEKLRTSN